MANNFPDDPEGWVERSEDFLEVAEEPDNAGIFNLSEAQLAEQRAQTNVVKATLSTRENAQHIVDGANADLKVQTPPLSATVRGNLKIAAASPAPANEKAEAGVTIPKERTRPAPKVPSKLVATPKVDNTVALKWDRNNNIAGCKFVIEKLQGETWNMVDVVTAISYIAPAKVGEHAVYRIRARNGQGTSSPSNEASIYDS